MVNKELRSDGISWVGLENWFTLAHPQGYPVLDKIRWREVETLEDKSVLPVYMKRLNWCIICVYFQSEDRKSDICVLAKDIPKDVYRYLRKYHSFQV